MFPVADEKETAINSIITKIPTIFVFIFFFFLPVSHCINCLDLNVCTRIKNGMNVTKKLTVFDTTKGYV